MIPASRVQPSRAPAGGPFDLADAHAYRRWRERKLADYPAAAEQLVVEVADAARLSEAERAALLGRVRKANMAFYAATARDAGPGEAAGEESAKQAVRALGARLGLRRLDANPCADDDGITPLAAVEGGARQRYIPYSNRPLNWHTDGYYNPPQRRVRACILHCVCDAESGGETLVMDPEVAYVLLRDEDPAYVAALSHARAMTIPANEAGGERIRAAVTGPVFSVDAQTGTLHMRYTARARNVEWRDEPLTREAAAFLLDVLSGDSPYVFRHRLAPGQGLVCNNVLHARAGFRDAPAPGKRRLVYRARYHDRIAAEPAEDPRAQEAGP